MISKQSPTTRKKNNGASQAQRNLRQSPEVRVEGTTLSNLPVIDQKEIATRAWEIWQSEGCPSGKELDHWFRAEEELRTHQR